jgi:hypothetical protein
VVTVEVKKVGGKHSLRQGLLQFVCASLKSLMPVISCLTDMQQIAVAIPLVSAPRTAAQSSSCASFESSLAMLEFPGAAIRGIDPDVLRLNSEGNVNLQDTLLQPKRARLTPPEPSRSTMLEGSDMLQELMQGPDMANRADVDCE